MCILWSCALQMSSTSRSTSSQLLLKWIELHPEQGHLHSATCTGILVTQIVPKGGRCVVTKSGHKQPSKLFSLERTVCLPSIIFFYFKCYALFGMLLKGAVESSLLSEDEPLTPNIDQVTSRFWHIFFAWPTQEEICSIFFQMTVSKRSRPLKKSGRKRATFFAEARSTQLTPSNRLTLLIARHMKLQ